MGILKDTESVYNSYPYRYVSYPNNKTVKFNIFHTIVPVPNEEEDKEMRRGTWVSDAQRFKMRIEHLNLLLSPILQQKIEIFQHLKYQRLLYNK